MACADLLRDQAGLVSASARPSSRICVEHATNPPCREIPLTSFRGGFCSQRRPDRHLACSPPVQCPHLRLAMTGGHPQSQKRAAEMVPTPQSYKYYIPKDHQNDWDYGMNMYDVEERLVSMMKAHCDAGTILLGHLVKTDQPYGWRILIRQKGEFYRAQLVTIEQFHNGSMAVELDIMEMLFDCREFRPKNKWIRMESEHHCTGMSMFLVIAGRHCKSVENAVCSLDKRIMKEIESLKPRRTIECRWDGSRD